MTLINAIRGHLAEFGILAPVGPQHMGRLIERVADPTTPIPAMAREALNQLIDQLVQLGQRIDRNRRLAPTLRRGPLIVRCRG
ncbi:hypothetical protein ACLF3G_27245 [Falsiroseomonas sp. HC035]|uniref:hypothetical protein n=1 Tax=Falsiroseomonas sp. HC035 TaxID=3390999 RepID=UPI003D31E1AD